MLVRTNSGMLLIRSGGLERPPTAWVIPRATSRAIYNVPPKKITDMMDSGCMR